MSEHKRVVVTGMGIVSPLGTNLVAVWDRLISGVSGITHLPEDMVGGLGVKIAGVVPDIKEDIYGFDPSLAVPAKDRKKMDRFIQFAMEAARQAIGQARWEPEDAEQRSRTATVIASGIGGLPAIERAVHAADVERNVRLSPFTIPSFLVNLAAGQVSIRYGFSGPTGAPATACAASNQAIGDAMRLIRSGEADVAVCGGAEASITRTSLASFAAARSLSTGFNHDPHAGSRPFDNARDGFVMGEGAGILVIESLEHAQMRGATPIAEVVGYGTTSDGYHMTSVPPDGEGAQRAIRAALAMARVSPHEIGYINAHATSTPVGDRAELNAIRAVFGEKHSPAISSTKSATGHLLGAAGGVEAVFSILALASGVLPPTLNLIRPDDAANGLDIIGNQARNSATTYALSNGFGFGGVNAAVLFRRWDGA